MSMLFKKSDIPKMSNNELEKRHKQYANYIFGVLIVLAIVSFLAVWEYLPFSFIAAMPVAIILLWPFILRTNWMANERKKRVQK